MRTDTGSTYCLPALSCQCYNNNNNNPPSMIINDGSAAGKDVVEECMKTTAASSIIGPDDDDDDDDDSDNGMKTTTTTSTSTTVSNRTSITFNLHGLPLIHDDGTQTGVGATAWYGSAVLSSMLLLGCEQMHQDLCMSKISKQQRRTRGINVLELGSGAIGLAGMTMAWILAQQQQKQQQHIQNIGCSDEDEQGEEKLEEDSFHSSNGSTNSISSTNKVFLTDCDEEVLEQLQINASEVTEQLQQHFGFSSLKEKDNNNNYNNIPKLHATTLDWEEHDQVQAVLMENKIDVVVGAELAYTSNNCLALQVSKILRLNPHAVVWILQKPRSGWFQVLQMELKKIDNDNTTKTISIEKYNPQTHFDPHVIELAQSIMPTPELYRDINDLRAIRISTTTTATTCTTPVKDVATTTTTTAKATASERQ